MPSALDDHQNIIRTGEVAGARRDDRFGSNVDLTTLFHGLPDTYAGWKANNFVPRIGIAYQLNDKTVVRTAFGGFKNNQSSGLSAPPAFEEATDRGFGLCCRHAVEIDAAGERGAEEIVGGVEAGLARHAPK